jgi:uridylate kinase
MNNGVVDEVKRLKTEIDNLPIEDRVKLIQEVLKGSELQVIMGGGNFISAEIVLQIQNGSAEQLAEIFRALAVRVSHEKEKS